MNELANYNSADTLARIFFDSTESIKTHLSEVDRLTAQLNQAFGSQGYGFGIAFEYHGRTREKIESIVKLMKLDAWAAIIEHTGIRKVMSARRQNELDRVLSSHNPSEADKLPDICADTIVSVLNGFADSLAEFLNEAIDEIYDWIKPGSFRCGLATNRKSIESNKLESKVIKGYIIDGRQWTENGKAGWSVRYDSRAKLMALDNIFHLLDGKGALPGHRGPLLDSIGLYLQGSTDYFRFKGFKNGNLHLEFVRYDLLRKFNEICGRNRLGNKPNQQTGSGGGLFELIKT